MRIHTSADHAQIREATKGLPGVYANITEHGSKTHAHAFEINLEGNGRYGGQWGDRDAKSATWDEWGVVMARIFAIDPNTRMGGSAKRPVYANAEDFRWQTNGRFGGWDDNDEFFARRNLPDDTHAVHRWDWQGMSAGGGYSVAQCRKCSAVKRWALVERAKAYA